MDIERLRTKVNIECDQEYFDRLHLESWEEHIGQGGVIEQDSLDSLARGIAYQTQEIFTQLVIGEDVGICEVLSRREDDDIGAYIITLKPDFEGVDDESVVEAEKFPTYAHFHVVMYLDRNTGDGIAYSLFVSDGYDFNPPSNAFKHFDPNVNMEGKLAGLYAGDSDFSGTTPKKIAQIIEANETLGSFCEMTGIELPDNYFTNANRSRLENAVE